MKNKKSTLFFFFAFTFFTIGAQAQPRLLGIANGDVRQALEKVLADFPKNFSTLKGEVLSNDPQSVEYASLLSFKTAEKNSITEYSGKFPVYSWQAQMLTTEEFQVAEKKYKSLYKELKSMSLTLNRDYHFSLEGEYDAPDESRKFVTTAFQLTPLASGLSNTKVELSMQFEFPEWKVSLTVYQREREDDERGKTKD